MPKPAETPPTQAQRAAWQAALSDNALQNLAGASVFRRGQTYASGGAVQAQQVQATGFALHAQATVSGTQNYQATLDVTAEGQLNGGCDCPHAQDGWFCKHQVALALVLRAQLSGQPLATDAQAQKKVAAAAKRAQTQAAKQQKLRDFVQGQSAQALADWLWQQAERDRTLMAALQAWATVAATGSDWPSIQASIQALTPSARGFLDWMDASRYAQRAQPLLDIIKPLLHTQPELARQACEHALLRLYKAGHAADDSNGDLSGLVQTVQDVLVQSLRLAPPPAAWLERWLALLQADPWGMWNEAEVLQAAGEPLRQRYQEHASRDWQRWQASHPSSGPQRSMSYLSRDELERLTLRRRYIQSLQSAGDVAAVIEAMRASAQTDSEWAELIAYCNQHGHEREGMQYAQHAVKLLGKHARMSEKLLLMAYERDGWDAEALALRRRRFESNPWDTASYEQLLQAAQAAGQSRQAYRQQLFDWAERQEQARGRGTGAGGRDVSLRLTWLLHEGQLDEALALVQAPGHQAMHALLQALALRLPAAQHAAAAALLHRVFEHAMPTALSPYTLVLKLVREIVQRQSAADNAAWLAELHERYKAKRNFIKGLPALS